MSPWIWIGIALFALIWGFIGGVIGGKSLRVAQIALLKRLYSEQAITLADLEGLYGTLLASHKRMAGRLSSAASRERKKNGAQNDDPDPKENVAEYKKAMRLKYLHGK